MSAIGIIFSDVHSWNVAEITASRTVASIPFSGRYRLVDFALSNMVNADIYKIGLITKSNYQSLIDHIASGKDWDLSRKNGGVVVLPPYGIGDEAGPFKGRLDALKRTKKFIESAACEHVVMADCDILANIDYKDVIRFHKKSGADITAVYTKKYIDRQQSRHSIIYNTDGNGRVLDILLNPESEGEMNAGLNSWVMTKEKLLHIISDASTHGLMRFSKDILLDNVKALKIMGYENKGYTAHIESLAAYVKSNMDMISKVNRDELFEVDGRPIHTKIRDSSPTKYGVDSVVKNSLIADGCVIDGTVENSILFRGVKVSRGSVLKNCIIMQGTVIENNAALTWIISDKNVIVRDNRVLSADKSYPFYIAKGKMV